MMRDWRYCHKRFYKLERRTSLKLKYFDRHLHIIDKIFSSPIFVSTI